MLVAAENGAQGTPIFASEFGDPAWQMSLSGDIAIVRVRDAALTPDQIKATLKAEGPRFGVTGQQAPAAE